MPQTRFVTRKALALGLRPILVVNKIDRAGLRSRGRRRRDLRSVLRAGRDRRAARLPDRLRVGARGLGGPRPRRRAAQDLGAAARPDRRDRCRRPRPTSTRRWRCTSTTLDYDDYLGYVAIGRIESGRIKPGERAAAASHRNGKREEFRVAKLLGFQALKRFELAEAAAGDICAVTGMQDLTVGETITEIARPDRAAAARDRRADGQDAVHVQQRARSPARRASTSPRATCATACSRRSSPTSPCASRRPTSPDTFEVLGRGELHLTVLIETMRREGYELMVSQPQVIFKDGRGRREARALRGGGHRPRRGLLGRGHRGARPARRAHAGDGARRARGACASSTSARRAASSATARSS